MLLTAKLDRLSATDWQPFFAQERAKPYFAELDAFVTAAAAERTVYPAPENIFAAFRACPAAAVRAVILGQDPYHEPGQAMGLSFSVPDACKAPPSLRNIFKELENETGTQRAHNDLTPWAQQGVLLCKECAGHGGGGLLPLDAGSFAAMRHVLFSEPKRMLSFSLSGETEKRFAAACEVFAQVQFDRRFKTLDFYKSMKIDN